jgi:flap endonuclease-1
MGIKGLNKLISQNVKNNFIEKNITEFSGKKIAIDSEILLYKFRCKDDGDSLNSHIVGFFNNVLWFLKNKITPVYIFDGKPTIEKQQNALMKRTIQKEKVIKKAQELESIFIDQIQTIYSEENVDSENTNKVITEEKFNETCDELFKLQKKIKTQCVTKDHKIQCKYLLKLMGIPYINATDDAEALCVALQYNGLVDYIYTEDTDAIVYSSAYICKNVEYNPIILRQSKKNINSFVVIDVKEILKELNMTSESFIDLCILCGCDFCKGIPGIGPIKGLNYMKKYGGIENMLEKECIEDTEEFKYNDARNLFKKDHMVSVTSPLCINKFDVENFKIYLKNERSLDPEVYVEKYNTCLKNNDSQKIPEKVINTKFLSFFKIIT